jgi:hypothetical protein
MALKAFFETYKDKMVIIRQESHGYSQMRSQYRVHGDPTWGTDHSCG